MKSRKLIFFILLCGAPRVNAGTNPPVNTVEKLYLGLSYDFTYKLSKWLPWPHDEWQCAAFDNAVITGSYWAVSTKKGPILVTACHVTGINIQKPSEIAGHQIDGINTFLLRKRSSLFISALAYKSEKLGLIESQPGDSRQYNDLAFLKPYDNRVLATLRVLQASPNDPQVQETVQVFGCPGTASQQVMSSTVASVMPDQGFFTLNTAVDKGYSGGVVMDSTGNRAYGVITNIDEGNKQTTVLRITPDIFDSISWNDPAKALNQDY